MCNDAVKPEDLPLSKRFYGQPPEMIEDCVDHVWSHAHSLGQADAVLRHSLGVCTHSVSCGSQVSGSRSLPLVAHARVASLPSLPSRAKRCYRFESPCWHPTS